MNKVLLPLNGGTVIESAVLSFADRDKFQKIIVTYSPPDRDILVQTLKDMPLPVEFVEGGATRQDSVYRGLKALEMDNPDTVLIHDGARPWISGELVAMVLEQTEQEGCSVPVIPSVNAMKKIDEKGVITEHLKREKTVSAQTPQGFRFREILDAHRKASEENYAAIDDTEIWDRYCGPVNTVPGDPANRKITYREDINGL